MDDSSTFNPHVVVMAKQPIPGQVKTRLLGRLTPGQAAAIHRAMLDCVLERAAAHLPGIHVLATPPPSPAPSASPDALDGSRWRWIDQGTGDLGARMDHVWRALGAGPIVFLGVDSPDVPAQALRAIPAALRDTDAAIGPVCDGGYWTLAANRYLPQLLTGIDWGTANVYHQTVAAAAGRLSVTTLPVWHDVDEPDDLDALRHRLQRASAPLEPALIRLRDRLRQVCKDAP